MMKTGLILLATSAYGLVCQSSQSKRLVALPSSKLKNGANLAQLPLNDVTPVNPELDGVRKAFALFNQGLIDRKEVAEYAARLSFVERERLNAKAAAEARQRERVVQLERLATGCLLMASGVGMLASKGVSMVIKAGSELIGGACVSAMQAAKTSVEGAGDAAKRAAGDAVNSAIDVSIDFLFRAPVRKVQETMVQVATAPGRRAAEAIRAPVVQAEQGVNSTKAKIAATADAVSRAVKAAPQDIRSTANIAELVARGTAKFATEAVQEQRARGKINRQKAVDALDQDASQQPLQDTSTSTSSSLFRQDEIIVDGTLPEDALVDTFRAMAKWTALKAKETALKAAKEARESTLAAARDAAKEAIAAREARETAIKELAVKERDAADRLNVTTQQFIAEAEAASKAQASAGLAPISPETGVQLNRELAGRTLRAKEARDRRLPAVEVKPPTLARSVAPAVPQRTQVDERRAVDVAAARQPPKRVDNSEARRKKQAELVESLINQSAATSNLRRRAGDVNA